MTRPGVTSLFDAPPQDQSGLAGPLAGLSYGAGWHRGPGDIWSSDLEAELWVDPEIFPEPQDLILEVLCFGASPSRPVRLSCEGGESLTLGAAIPKALRLRTPAPGPDGQPGRIVLRIDRITSPFRLGVSGDDRLLGLRILGVVPDLPDLRFPLQLSAPGIAEICLGPGWGATEPEGVWTDSAHAQLRLPRHLRPSDGWLEGALGVLSRGEQAAPLRIEIASRGVTLLQTTSTVLAQGRLVLPLRGTWIVGEPLVLDFHFEGLQSPADLGLAPDPRLLGLFLRRLDFHPY